MWYIPALVVVYIFPAASLIFFPLKHFIIFGKFHTFVGRIEWRLSIVRDYILSPLLAAAAVYHRQPLLLIFVALSIWAMLYRRSRKGNLISFVINNNAFDSDCFFALYFATISNMPGVLPVSPPKKLERSLDFTGSKFTPSIWPILRGIFYTAALAKLVVRAAKLYNKDVCRDLGDKVAMVWGVKVLKLIQGSLKIEGEENLKSISGSTIFVSEHKSFLDFLLLPMAIGLSNINRVHPFRARYVAAKDHFYDNKFLYHIIGLGRAMEKLGTVFVDRKNKTRLATAAVTEATGAIVKDGIDIVMFPQGTRARASTDLNGNRMPVGYYTTGKKENLLKERGHLKKGAAYMALDAVCELGKSKRALNIVPVGLWGVGVTAPKGALKIKRGVQLKVNFGKPVRLQASDYEGLMNMQMGSPAYFAAKRGAAESLHIKIDDMLKETGAIKSLLRKRLMIDTRRFLKGEDIERTVEALGVWGADEDLIFSIIDCIYAAPAKKWEPFLRQLCHMITETDRSKEEFINFKKVVVDSIKK